MDNRQSTHDTLKLFVCVKICIDIDAYVCCLYSIELFGHNFTKHTLFLTYLLDFVILQHVYRPTARERTSLEWLIRLCQIEPRLYHNSQHDYNIRNYGCTTVAYFTERCTTCTRIVHDWYEWRTQSRRNRITIVN